MIILESTALPDWLDVSRETHQRLRSLWEMVGKWNPAINLVARSTMANGWDRHVLDSAQIFELGGLTSGLWADFGSGAGFPGLVLAAIAAEKAPDLKFALVESDRRKATFIGQAARSLGLSVQMITDRVENLDSMQADAVTARAFAPLDQLCGYAARHLKVGGGAIFPKGAAHMAEMERACAVWAFDHQIVPSRTDPNGVVLLMRNIRHA